MRKLLAIVVGLLSLVVIALSASYSALHTKYAAQVVNTALEYVYDGQVQVRGVTYSYQEPHHIQLDGVLIKRQDNSSTLIEQMDIWLGDQIWAENKIQIDNVVIDGVKLQSGWPKMTLPRYMQLNQLSIANIDFANQGWVARDVNIQIKQPKHRDAPLLPFYGEIQLSADQLYWQGEALDKVYLDVDITPTHTTFYDIRFQWRQGQFAAQATKKQTETEWQLPRVSITGLRLQQNDLDSISKASLNWFDHIPMLIDDLTISESSIETSLLSANNIKLNANDLRLPLQVWQQRDTSVFATADNMSLLGQAIQSPAMDISLQPDTVNIRDISLEMLQGNLHLQGTLTPTSLNLAQLNINNMKWFPTPETKQHVADYLQQLENIEAKMVTINNVQFIDLTTTPAKQASGLSIEGDNIEIKKDKHWGLWRGKLTVSASNATYDNVTSKNPIVSMHSKEGHFWLDKLFIPLENGLVKGTADMAFNQTSQPWNVNLEASGIPLRFFSRWFDLPLHLDGITDFTVKGEGLYGDELIFNHSVTGKLDASVTRATSEDDFQTLWLRNQGIKVEPLVPPQDETSLSTEQDAKENAKAKSQANQKKDAQPVTISDIHLVADRGRLSLKPFSIDGKDFSAHFGGEYDFLFPEKGNLQYRLEGQCQALIFNLLGDRNSVQVENDCR
ncbi:AsmA family protein [Vibrio gangliei]|uniref:AsmA family protein n=1 Tax=Vibrio gangliei TaxID=2077090 RepID=UPI000D01EF40|nr:AsmA family protein [Vibrio gangliei]